MGLSQFPITAEGMFPALIINTIFSMALLKNLVRSLLHVMGIATWNPTDFEDEYPFAEDGLSSSSSSSSTTMEENSIETTTRKRRTISTTHFNSLSVSKNSSSHFCDFPSIECCVCLCGFEDNQEVSELSCKHFFHKGCLDNWFDKHKHSTCPLCRSIE